jgi:hypothetical protein
MSNFFWLGLHFLKQKWIDVYTPIMKVSTVPKHPVAHHPQT